MIKCKMLRYINDDDNIHNDNDISYIDKFDYTIFEHDGRLNIHIEKEIEVVEQIYEIIEEHEDMIVLGENSMNKKCYEALKKNKYENNDNNNILVYLGDL